MLVETFFACFRQFFLTQNDHFSKTLDFALGPFFQFLKSSHFSKIKRFLESYFAKNVCNVLVETFFACLRQFFF